MSMDDITEADYMAATFDEDNAPCVNCPKAEFPAVPGCRDCVNYESFCSCRMEVAL